MIKSCKNSKIFLRDNSIFWIKILHQYIFLKSKSYIKIYLASITSCTQAPISSSRASKPPTWRGEREVSFCISLNSKCHLISLFQKYWNGSWYWDMHYAVKICQRWLNFNILHSFPDLRVSYCPSLHLWFFCICICICLEFVFDFYTHCILCLSLAQPPPQARRRRPCQSRQHPA